MAFRPLSSILTLSLELDQFSGASQLEDQLASLIVPGVEAVTKARRLLEGLPVPIHNSMRQLSRLARGDQKRLFQVNWALRIAPS